MNTIYIFKRVLNNNFIHCLDELEASDMAYRININTGEKEFQYMGKLPLAEYHKVLGSLKARVQEELSKISVQSKDDRGGTINLIQPGKEARATEIRENEQKAHSIVLERLSEKADKTMLKKKEWIFANDLARQVIEGGLSKISI
jgi:hypothetical protein